MKRGAIFWGGMIIFVGVLLLLNNLHIITANVGGIIFAVLIIALGVWILWGNYSKRSVKLEQIQIPIEAAARAKIRIRHGAGRLEVGAGADEGSLVSGNCVGGANVRSQKNGEDLDVTLSIPDISMSWFNWWPGNSLDWNLKLAQGLPLDLSFDIGAADTNIDLSSLLVNKISLNSGASSTRVTLPASAGFTTASFKTGAASLDLRIPNGVAARIRASGGLANISVDSRRFPRSGGIYQSPDYETAANRVEIQVDTGVGSVDIR